jgi:hypothetical protein
VKQGEVDFKVRKNGQAVQVLSPIDGIMSHINNELLDQPELANDFPYEKGWLFIIEPAKLRKNLKSLFYGEETHKYMNEEKERLISPANEDLRLAADGGLPVDNIFEDLEGENWAKLVKIFLKT